MNILRGYKLARLRKRRRIRDDVARYIAKAKALEEWRDQQINEINTQEPDWVCPKRDFKPCVGKMCAHWRVAKIIISEFSRYDAAMCKKYGRKIRQAIERTDEP